MPSLNTEHNTTKTKGTVEERGLKGDIDGIADSIEMPRKYMFAKRLNWKRIENGKKVKALYFVVLM